MKVYKLEVMVIDQDIDSVEEAKALFDIKFPNWTNVQVVTCRESEIVEWDDDNPLNCEDTQELEMSRLFPVNKKQVVDLNSEYLKENSMKERICLEDSTTDAVVKLAEGNPGAMTALTDVLSEVDKIDPDCPVPIMPLLRIDSLGIYGADIYVLWNDICERNLVKFLGVLRGCQLGIISESLVKDAASRQDYSGKGLIDVERVLEEVKAKLPNFGKSEQ